MIARLHNVNLQEARFGWFSVKMEQTHGIPIIFLYLQHNFHGFKSKLVANVCHPLVQFKALRKWQVTQLTSNKL